MRRRNIMLLSMFLSFHLVRKVSSRDYVQLTTILILVFSLFSMILPLSFPFYTLLKMTLIPMRFYMLYFLTFKISESVFWINLAGTSVFIQRYFLMFLLYYLFFLSVNIVGAIIGYWIGKSAILERLFKT